MQGLRAVVHSPAAQPRRGLRRARRVPQERKAPRAQNVLLALNVKTFSGAQKTAPQLRVRHRLLGLLRQRPVPPRLRRAQNVLNAQDLPVLSGL